VKTIRWILGITVLLALYAFCPVGACPRKCGEPVPQLVGYTKLPGVTPQDAEKMLAWGRSFPCWHCGSRRYLTLHRCTFLLYEGLGFR
jgi:hypothetical protein